MNKAKLMRWVKRALLLTLLLLLLQLVTLSILMAFQVSRTPSYDGGKAYIDYSPDGKYKGALVFIAKEHRNRWVWLGMDLTGDSVKNLYLLTDPSGKEVYAIMPIDKHWVSSGSGTIWRCGERRDEVCTGLRDGYLFEAQLPVSSWQRLHAWLTVRLKGLQDAEFAEVVVR